MIYDLHTHTQVSDGKLSPSELLARAKEFHVNAISITDHDTVKAYDELTDKDKQSITLIPGIEFSSVWRKTGVHIVGLNIDLNNDALKQTIQLQQKNRQERAKTIIDKLAKKLSQEIALEQIESIARNNNIGRPHIAEYLVQNKIVENQKEAFDKYLGTGKIGDIKNTWLDLETIIKTITNSNGIAVLAHPAKYKLTRTKLIELLSDFKNYGGQAFEVVSGKQVPHLTRDLARISEAKELYASCGSDFHQTGHSWSELGKFGKLPENCKPVWELF